MVISRGLPNRVFSDSAESESSVEISRIDQIDRIDSAESLRKFVETIPHCIGVYLIGNCVFDRAVSWVIDLIQFTVKHFIDLNRLSVYDRESRVINVFKNQNIPATVISRRIRAHVGRKRFMK